MQGRICLVTGATSGVGAATARELARRGATVVIVGRDAGKCARGAANIRKLAGPCAEFLVANLSSQQEVRRLLSG
jgi:NAD(P)-dependent dehydrogenase (short-subunit alcohol dehydrogenase family)